MPTGQQFAGELIDAVPLDRIVGERVHVAMAGAASDAWRRRRTPEAAVR